MLSRYFRRSVSMTFRYDSKKISPRSMLIAPCRFNHLRLAPMLVGKYVVIWIADPGQYAVTMRRVLAITRGEYGSIRTV